MKACCVFMHFSLNESGYVFIYALRTMELCSLPFVHVPLLELNTSSLSPYWCRHTVQQRSVLLEVLKINIDTVLYILQCC